MQHDYYERVNHRLYREGKQVKDSLVIRSNAAELII